MTKRRRSPYMAIMRAAALGQGVHLSAEEVCLMSLDTAIATVAAGSLSEQEGEEMYERGEMAWAHVNPYRLPPKKQPATEAG